MILSDLEKTLIKKFVEKKFVSLQDEESFFSSLNVESRDFTGVGFSVNLKKSEKLKVGDTSESYIWGDLGAKLNSSLDTGYLFYVENGYLISIEGYTYAEDWPDSISEIEVYDI